MKRCSACALEKPFSAFSPRAKNRDGYAGRCRVCIQRRNRERREADPVKARKTSRIYSLRHRDGYDDETIGYVFDVLDHDPCAYCGNEAAELDHIEPRAAGGANHWTNLTASCRACNTFKQERSLLLTLANRHGFFQQVPPGAVVSLKKVA